MVSTAYQVSLLMLLALQVGVQPLLMGWYATSAHDVRLRVGVVEVLKLLLTLALLSLGRGEAGISNQLKTWRWRTAFSTTVLPALIYLLQNLLNHAAVVTLDGVTFNVLNQTKIIWTALLVYLLLGIRQSPLQLVALALLCVAAVLMTASSRATHNAMQRKTDSDVWTGMYQALLGAVLSALAGCIIQKALQKEKRNQYMVTVELSVLGEVTLLALAFVQDRLLTSRGNADSQDSMWDGWSVMTLGALMCQALGGVLVGFVIRDCGNVEKNFAVVGGMGLTAWLETFFNGKPFCNNALVAMVLVTISTALYTLKAPANVLADVRQLAHHLPTKDVTTPTPSYISNARHFKKRLSADLNERESIVTHETIGMVSSTNEHANCVSRQEMRRNSRQLQPLCDSSSILSESETIV
ncbi:cmp-sialic acid transporter 5-like [Plasmopara halstedii]|uniref:Cmp-sialic acid transporter 5-like n=1 Tax=Plasmopara halstedii TaxID=4781 RepID=A0A0N7L637_PLAHL|nr:cmp-sialic acid transporter 5-like [Plasmopara halstedii]CEG43187.1 cmp-sialic acid transporter 5-like [Plasmopara halstedii]|eukprot:XP_024579556.1 cmp-sialic acid transporter 5-like [Plasmopara halstedii]